jgi:aminoglycoside phosphotransferase (APT) family kinase protein
VFIRRACPYPRGPAVTAPSEEALDTVAIADFLASTGTHVESALTWQLIAGGRSNLTYRVSDGASTWVIRRPPAGGWDSSAHNVEREQRVTRALEPTKVPVPRTVASCDDLAVIGVPFTVTEFVEGRTIRSQQDLAALQNDEVQGCVEGLIGVLRDLHEVDYLAVGLSGFGRPDGYAARQLRRWGGQWDAAASADTGPARRLRDRLEAAVPAQAGVGIVHGDYRIDNVLLALDDFSRVNAVVDWELSTIGDPVADVALMCAYRHPAFDLALGMPAAWTSERLPSADALAEMYEKATGARLAYWEFHLGLAYFKLASIARGIDERYRQGVTVGSGFASAVESVPLFLDEGLKVTTTLA